jgi:hypothetical protein
VRGRGWGKESQKKKKRTEAIARAIERYVGKAGGEDKRRWDAEKLLFAQPTPRHPAFRSSRLRLTCSVEEED